MPTVSAPSDLTALLADIGADDANDARVIAGDRSVTSRAYPSADRAHLRRAVGILAALCAKVDALAAPVAGTQPAAPFDFAAFADDKSAWSIATFGPGARTAGVLDHIRKELAEIEKAPADVSEWVDVIILAMDGAWRSAGATGAQLVEALKAKMAKNKARTWPDWRTQPADRAIEHDRSGDAHPTLPERMEDCTREDVIRVVEYNRTHGARIPAPQPAAKGGRFVVARVTEVKGRPAESVQDEGHARDVAAERDENPDDFDDDFHRYGAQDPARWPWAVVDTATSPPAPVEPPASSSAPMYPPTRSRFDCSECGERVKVDEDQCCATCGRDCALVLTWEPDGYGASDREVPVEPPARDNPGFVALARAFDREVRSIPVEPPASPTPPPPGEVPVLAWRDEVDGSRANAAGVEAYVAPDGSWTVSHFGGAHDRVEGARAVEELHRRVGAGVDPAALAEAYVNNAAPGYGGVSFKSCDEGVQRRTVEAMRRALATASPAPARGEAVAWSETDEHGASDATMGRVTLTAYRSAAIGGDSHAWVARIDGRGIGTGTAPDLATAKREAERFAMSINGAVPVPGGAGKVVTVEEIVEAFDGDCELDADLAGLACDAVRSALRPHVGARIVDKETP